MINKPSNNVQNFTYLVYINNYFNNEINFQSFEKYL